MLDDDDRWRTVTELCNELKRSIGVVIIIVGQLLALHLLGLRNACNMWPHRYIKRRTLMRVFAIAKLSHAIAIDRKHVRKQLLLIGKGKPLADHAVIGSSGRIGFRSAFAAEVITGFAVAFLKLGNKVIIIGWVGQDRNKRMVLGRAAHHGRTANIDIFDNFIARGTLGYRFSKGVQVHHHKVDCANPMLHHRGSMFGVIAHRQQATMHHWMQRLDPPVHHFRKASQLANILHRQASSTKRFCRPARRHQFNMPRRERVAKLNQSSLVGHRQQGPFNDDVLHILILNGAVAS